MIKVGFLISYDWELLQYALPAIYDEADHIHLALDANRKTWSGSDFHFDEIKFKSFIQSSDPAKKITLFEESFYHSNLSPKECEVRERRLLAESMGSEGWHIQLDADEFFIDFEGFCQYLRKINPHPTGNEKPLNVLISSIELIKKLEKGYLYIPPGNNTQKITVATTKPAYTYGRISGHFNHLSPFYALHNTWARDREEIIQKVKNWGHRDDFNSDSYLKLWDALDKDNYQYVQNFYFIEPYDNWPSVQFESAHSIDEMIDQLSIGEYTKPKSYYWIKNSRWLARIRKIFKVVFRRSF